MQILAFAFLFLLVTLPQFSASKPRTVTFTIDPHQFIVLPAKVGDIPARFIFDTGSGIDVMAPSLIAKAQGKPSGQFTVFSMRGEKLDLSLFVVPELTVGPMKKKSAVVASWDVLDKLHIDGIVSINDFRYQPVTLDFIKKRVIFETPASLVRRRAAGITIPLKFDDMRGVALDIFARFLIGDESGLCEVDTGSQNATVSARYMAALGIEKTGKTVQKHQWTTATGASALRYDTALSHISFAAAPQIKLVNPTVSFSDIIYDCAVGIDFWSDKVLTIDIPSHEMIVLNPSTH